MRLAVPRRAIATIVASLILFISPLHGQDEVRALWVVRTTPTSPAAIATMVKEAKNGGFNTLLVQVRGRGDAYFQNGMVPRALADELAGADPHSPGYVGRLARYARNQSSEIEGLYLSPVPAGSAQYTTAVVRDAATRHDIDRVHFDDIRYPTGDFDYSHDTLTAFRLLVAVLS